MESNKEKKDTPSKPELHPNKDNSAAIKWLGKKAVQGASKDKPKK